LYSSGVRLMIRSRNRVIAGSSLSSNDARMPSRIREMSGSPAGVLARWCCRSLNDVSMARQTMSLFDPK
jgi:hypothetical protein